MMNVLMPSLGLTMEEGRIVEWLKAEGDTVEEGQPLFVIESEKAVLEINAPYSGVLQKILVETFKNVPVGQVIALIGSESGDVDTESEQESGEKEAPVENKSENPAAKQTAEPLKKESVVIKASPLARKLAAKHGIDLSSIEGAGKDGRISKEDVENAIAAVKEGTPLTGIRGIIASRMSESSNTTAPVTLTCQADASGLVNVRKTAIKNMAAEGIKPSFNDILCLIVREALAKHKDVNSFLKDDVIYKNDSVNIGIAVDTDAGLIVPVIKNAEKLSLKSIVGQSAELISRAQKGELLPDELTGGTFTITNLGMFGVEFFTPIINIPQSAVLGVGSVSEVPVVKDGQLTAGKVIFLSLTFDHRVVDGAPAARFLQTIKSLIENISPDYLGI